MTNLKYSASAPPDNFGGLPASCSTQKNSSIIVLPVPFDESSSWMKGSDKGPRAIIRASQNMELYDIETGSEVYKKGIHTAKPVISKKPLDMIGKVRRHVVKALNDDKFVVVLGGEHTVSLGAIEAHAEYYNDLSILHLDAHSDMRDSYEGNKYSHACVMARAKEMSGKIISAGIRSMDSLELKNIERKNMFYASEVRGSNDWIKRAVRRLSKNVYVTIDLDVFDPSIMPSTGTPGAGRTGLVHSTGPA